LLDQPPNRFDHHPLLRGLLASSGVSTAGSGAGVAVTGAGEGVGAKLSPLETGAGSRTVDLRRGTSGMDGSGMTGAGAGGGDGELKSATVSCVTGSLAAGASD
jgi:hypothetical protein